MRYLVNKESRYEQILELLCNYKGIEKENFIEILKDNECRYLLFLLMKKYDCLNMENLKRDFSLHSKKVIINNLKTAEEKLLFNRRIREMFFEAENIIESNK